MNQMKCKSNVQLTLDDDFNVPDVKPDIDRMIKEQGEIILQEIKAMNGKVMIRGNLRFNILYLSEEQERVVHHILGEIPFEEIVNMDKVEEDDAVSARCEVEDLSTNLINSRKLSIKSIVSFGFFVENIQDEETAVAIEGDESVKFIQKEIQITQIALNKKDTFRIKEELQLPSSKPNLSEILYYEMTLHNVDTKLLEDRIDLRGEIQLFVLYAGEESAMEFMEFEIPINGTLECHGSKEEMVPDIDVIIEKKNIDMKPDEDGEERVLEIEVVLELSIKAYEEETLEVLNDLYSTAKELIPTIQDAHYETLLVKNNSKLKVVEQIQLKETGEKVLQICYASGALKIDDKTVVENGIEVNGILELQVLYLVENDKKPLDAVKGIIPFSHFIEAKGIQQESIYEIKPTIEQINTVMLDGKEIEARVSINMNTIVFDKIVEPIITELEVKDVDLKKLQMMPSVVGYMVKEGDTIWNIAKKFYTTIESIQEVNHMEREEIKPGDKLLILKKVDAVL